VAGPVLSLRGVAYRLSTRFRDLRDRALYPEAPGAAGQRIAMNHAADARIAAFDPASQSAVESSA
jgi:hypothetical protein